MTPTPEHWRDYLASAPATDSAVPLWAALLIQMQAQLTERLEIFMSQPTNADAIANLDAAWNTWAQSAITIINDLTAAWQAATAANASLTSGDVDVATAIAAGQQLVTALPVETDPTVTPAPTPGT